MLWLERVAPGAAPAGGSDRGDASMSAYVQNSEAFRVGAVQRLGPVIKLLVGISDPA